MTDKEKTIKELKEALDSLDITNKYRLNLIRAIEYLQKEKPVSEDLEKESKKYSSCIYLEEVLSDDDKEVLRGRLINTFKAGANWQKEKMMAKAVETTFNVSLSCGVYDKFKAKGCEEGDKLLIIKKEE